MNILRKCLATAVCGITLATAGVASAQLVVRVGPPRPVYERPGPVPHPGWVWQPGYHRWDGARYVWVPGTYAAPPYEHARWVPGHWGHRGGGYAWVEGHWRR